MTVDSPANVWSWLLQFCLHRSDRPPALPPAEISRDNQDRSDLSVFPETLEIEADTAEDEDIASLSELLLPCGVLPTDVELFSLSYSKALLGGWVKQPSPCCAAASIAGAWNAVAGRHRRDPEALSCQSVLRAMRTVLEDQIEAKTRRMEQLLGASIAPLVKDLENALALEGRRLGGRKGEAATSKILLRSIQSLTTESRGRVGRAPIYDRLAELYQADMASSEAGAADELGEEIAAHEVQGRVEGGEGEVTGGEEMVEGHDGIILALAGGAMIDREEQGNNGGTQEQDRHVAAITLRGPGSAPGETVTEGQQREGGPWKHSAPGQPRPATTRGSWKGPPKRPTCGAQSPPGSFVVREDDAGIHGIPSEGSSNSVLCVNGLDVGDGGSVVAGRGGGRLAGVGSGACTSRRTWKWRKELCELLKRKGGLEKLRAPRPSTSAIGGWGIIATVKQLNHLMAMGAADTEEKEVKAHLFMGLAKGRRNPNPKPTPNPVVCLSRGDGEEEKALQWAALREAFLHESQALIFHLKNHYAPIFAIREWRTPDPPAATGSAGIRADSRGGGGEGEGGSRWTRQILTARRGQRPSCWMDFGEAREIMLGWEGYQVLILARLSYCKNYAQLHCCVPGSG